MYKRQADEGATPATIAVIDGRIKIGLSPQQREALARTEAVSYTHLRAHETVLDLVCRLLLEKKQDKNTEPTRHAVTTTKRSSESTHVNLMYTPPRVYTQSARTH